MAAPARALISYSHVDESYRSRLISALSTARRAGEIEIWSDHNILPGQDIDKQILAQLREADIVFLLVSQDFIASDYCFNTELEVALERHRNGRAVVVPIVVRPTDWQGASFARLKMLPADAKPVSTWDNADEAWLNVAQEVRGLVRSLNPERNRHVVVDSKNIASQLARAFDQLQTRYANPSGRIGVSFGLPELDHLLDGIWQGELALAASRPEQGHVELAVALANHAAVSEGAKVFVLSQRLNAQQFTNRVLCALGAVSRARLLRGMLDDEDWSNIVGAIRNLRDKSLTIDDDVIRSETALRRKLQEVSDQGFDVIVIDGIEYVSSGAPNEEKAITLLLKDYARQKNNVVLATLSLSPEAEGGQYGRPDMASLGEWRAFEVYAEKIVFSSRSFWSFAGDTESELGVYVAKSVDGAIGLASLSFDYESGQISSGVPKQSK